MNEFLVAILFYVYIGIELAHHGAMRVLKTDAAPLGLGAWLLIMFAWPIFYLGGAIAFRNRMTK